MEKMEKMKKMQKIGAGAAVMAVLAGGCKGADKNELYIYNWTYYMPDSVIEKFEKEYGAKVVYDKFATNEDMYAKLKAGGSGYDIVFPSGDYTSIMIHQGMLARIDHDKIPNLKNIDPAVLQKATYDPGMEYSVPYYFGAAGIAVNTERVPDFQRSWSIFSREDLKDRMIMLDDMREVLGDALVYLGYSVNTRDSAQVEEAKNLIVDHWKPNLTKFDAEAFAKGYASGDFWVVQGYAEGIYEEIDDEALKKATVFFIPPEGGPAYIDSMCILRDAKHQETAHKFIDFIHRPEIYAEFCDTFGFPATANIPARQYKTGPSYYQVEDLRKVELKEDLGDDLPLYFDAWEIIRIGE